MSRTLSRGLVVIAGLVVGGILLAACGGSTPQAGNSGSTNTGSANTGSPLSSLQLAATQTAYSNAVVAYNTAFNKLGSEIRTDLKVASDAVATSPTVEAQGRVFRAAVLQNITQVNAIKYPDVAAADANKLDTALKTLAADFVIVGKGKGTTTSGFQAKLLRDENAVRSAQQLVAKDLGVLISTT